jgi:2-phospho-L-lactate/phosphoenolpyruvate guanylyltransferase
VTAAPPPLFTVVVPVKPTSVGKSRLRVADRAALARAIALDTIAAAAAAHRVAEVIVVTDDAELRASAASGRVRVIDEGEARGLDAAIARGVAAAATAHRAALLGDLPALRSGDLDAALAAAASVDRAVVADAEGTGSTLVTAGAGVPWASAFGDGSFARHVALGCAVLPVSDASTLRRDVDTAAQLAVAATLGVGPRTHAVLVAAG